MSTQPAQRHPFYTARRFVLAGLTLVGISLLLMGDLFYRTTVAENNQNSLAKTAGELQIRLEEAVDIRLLALEALHAFMMAGQALPPPEEFDRFAEDILSHYPEIRALQYVDPDRIIRRIHPIQGNEAALNLDLKDRPVAALVEKSIEENKTTLAAPTLLAQGSLSAIARTPLSHGDRFLGLVQGVFDVSAILEEALANQDTRFALQLRDGNGQIFWGEPGLTSPTFSLPVAAGDSQWTLSVTWAVVEPAPSIFVLLLVWGVGGALLVSLLIIPYRSWQQADWLHEQVEQKTASLQISEERYRNLFHHAPEGIFVANTTGNYLNANPAGLALLGYTIDELRQLHILDVVVPEDLPKNPLRVQELQTVPRLLSEHTLLHKAGHSIPVEIGASILPDGTLLGIVRDLTARKKAEAALRESEERYRSLFAALAEGVVLQKADGVIVACNRAAEQILGVTADQLIGHAPFQSRWHTVHEDGSPFPVDSHPYMRTLATGQSQQEIVIGIQGPPGNLIWLLINTEPVRSPDSLQHDRPPTTVVTSFVDITERLQAQLAERQYIKRLHILHLIDQSILSAKSYQEFVLAVLTYIDEVIVCERSSVTLLNPKTDGWVTYSISTESPGSLEDEPGDPVDSAFSQVAQSGQTLVIEDIHLSPAPTRHAHRRAMSEGMLSFVHIPLISHDNALGMLNLSSVRKANFGGEQVEMAEEVARQLSLGIQQARLQAALRRQTVELELRVVERTAELEQRTGETERLNRGMLAMLEDVQATSARSERIAAQLRRVNQELETFTYSVSHDLKAPLRGIDGYGRLLLEESWSQLSDEGRIFLGNIRQATVQMNQLIDDLLSYSRLERRDIHATALALPALLNALIEERSSEIQSRNVAVEVGTICSTVYADKEGLALVLRNLLDNALKFTQHSAQPRIEIGGRYENHSCILWVRDNGVGFDMQFHDRLFEIFQRLHRAEDYPGTGIGLAIVRKAIERMNGRVWAESEKEVGTTFFIDLPEQP